MDRNKQVLESFKVDLIEELRNMMLHALNGEILDPVFLLYKDAARESANFIKKHMHTALLFRGSDPTWRFWPYVLSKAPSEGSFLEFGVFKGESLSFFAEQRPEATFYGFDSFDGLPEDWSGGSSPKGFFAVNEEDKLLFTDVPNIKIIKGWFEESLQDFIASHFKKDIYCSFIHMDSNLYSSTSFVLEQLKPHIVAGTVILFDDFFNYPGYAHHDFKAFFDVIDKTFDYEFIAFQHMKAAIVIK